MSKALQTKDLSSMVMEAYAKGFVTTTNLNILLNLLPKMKATFKGTLESVTEMTEQLRDAVKAFQLTIPNDGSMSEAACNQLLVEMIKTGSALIRKVLGLVEGAI